MYKLVFSFYLVLSGITLGAQVPFSKTIEYMYGNYGGVSLTKGMRAANGDYISIGMVYVGNVGMTNYVILVTDSNGAVKTMKDIDTQDWWPLSTESDIVQTVGGGFLFCGNDPYGQGGVIIKYDSSLNILWNRLYASESMALSLDRLSVDETGNIYAFGTTSAVRPSSESTAFHLLLMKLDEYGNIINQAAVGVPDYDLMSSRFLRLPSGDFILAGNLYDPSFNLPKGILVKLNSSLQTVWAKVIIPDSLEYCTILDIEDDPVGNILVTGKFLNTYTNVSPFIASLDESDGSEVWMKSYSLAGNGVQAISLEDIIVEEDGTMTGTGYCTDSTSRVLFFRADASGEIYVAKRNEVSNEPDVWYSYAGKGIEKTPAGGYFLASSWSRFLIPIGYESGFNFMQLSPDGESSCPFSDLPLTASVSSLTLNSIAAYVQAGTTRVNDTSLFTESIVVTESYDDCGITGFDNRMQFPPQSLSVFPNPSNGSFHIILEGATRAGTFRVLDVTGHEIYRSPSIDPARLKSGEPVTLGLHTGIYVIELSSGDEHFVGKVVVK